MFMLKEFLQVGGALFRANSKLTWNCAATWRV